MPLLLSDVPLLHREPNHWHTYHKQYNTVSRCHQWEYFNMPNLQCMWKHDDASDFYLPNTVPQNKNQTQRTSNSVSKVILRFVLAVAKDSESEFNSLTHPRHSKDPQQNTSEAKIISAFCCEFNSWSWRIKNASRHWLTYEWWYMANSLIWKHWKGQCKTP